MDPTIAATVIGVLLSFCFAAFATAFAWLRSDMNARFDKVDDKVDTRFERLEGRSTAWTPASSGWKRRSTGLIMRLARSGLLTEPDDSGASD